ncbi:MAG: molecular chaperone TorD family protein [Methylobacteriaceae bacterium]|nr:molecular chaperone TorD family protein [Methylobacteriaceae bacterium]MBV9393532.1 molecular chaperone TorD family protein [Methylobacteriaceae bacterium]
MPDVGLDAVGSSRDSAPLLVVPDDGPPSNAASAEALAQLDDVALARANEYRLLAALLGRAPSQDLLGRIARITGDGTKLGRAHEALAEAARNTDADTLSREYFDLFIGVGRGEFLPYASYYLTGFLQERPLASIRDDMAAIGIVRAERSSEPEDHIAILCEVMAGLASREFDADLPTERRFFERHLKSWAPRFFADLETAASARFYRNVAMLGRLFLEIEAEGFAMLA